MSPAPVVSELRNVACSYESKASKGIIVCFAPCVQMDELFGCSDNLVGMTSPISNCQNNYNIKYPNCPWHM